MARVGRAVEAARLERERLEAERADGAGIELIKNEPCSHPQHGVGQYTLKHYHFHGKLPGWLKMIVTPLASSV